MARKVKVNEEGFPEWFDGKPLVMCRGGPYPHSVEYLSRWQQLRDGYGLGASWYRRGYVPTGQLVAHPEHPAVKVALLVWDATRAVTLNDEQWFQALPAATRRAS